MSALLRQAVRDFIGQVEDTTPIHDGSILADLRRVMHCEERAASTPEPAIVRDTDLHVARLVEALLRFAKPGGHFVGCPGDRKGHCSESCRMAQGALTRERLDWAEHTVAALTDTVAALERERWTLVLKVRSLQRPIGRPRKAAHTPTPPTRKTPPLQSARRRR